MRREGEDTATSIPTTTVQTSNGREGRATQPRNADRNGTRGNQSASVKAEGAFPFLRTAVEGRGWTEPALIAGSSGALRAPAAPSASRDGRPSHRTASRIVLLRPPVRALSGAAALHCPSSAQGHSAPVAHPPRCVPAPLPPRRTCLSSCGTTGPRCDGNPDLPTTACGRPSRPSCSTSHLSAHTLPGVAHPSQYAPRGKHVPTHTRTPSTQSHVREEIPTNACHE